MNKYAVAVWLVLTSVAHGAGGEFLLSVEEVDGARPRIEQAKGDSPINFGWLPVATDDSAPIRIGRQIQVLVSTDTRFHVQFREGGALIELKGMLRKAADDPDHAPVLTAGSNQTSLQAGQRADFIVEYEYAIEVEVDNEFAKVPSYRRLYARGVLPIRYDRKFCLGAVNLPRDFPTTLWSLKLAEKESQ